MLRSSPRLALATLAAGVLLAAILAGVVLHFRAEEQASSNQDVFDQEVAALYPEALQQVTESEAVAGGQGADSAELLVPILKTAEQQNMLGVAIFDADGAKVQAAPPAMLLAELAPDDYPLLLGGQPISRYDPQFPLARYFAGAAGPAPVLQVLLPLHGRDPTKILGFVWYFIDGRALALKLKAIESRVNREAAVIMAIGGGLIAAVLAAAYLGLDRAGRQIAERNERLIRANFELTLAAKASALGQITSHLIHGLQGPVAGLRAAVTDRSAADWKSAADYTERLQTMIQETVALLGDAGAHVSYALTGHELAETIRRHNAAAALDRGVNLAVGGGFTASLDSHRGSLLCLIATNLIQNAIAATPPGRAVDVALHHSEGAVTVMVADEGPGIPAETQAHLFEPGRSGRAGGTGLGLAISQLLARQIGASLAVVSSQPSGTTFRLTLPL